MHGRASARTLIIAGVGMALAIGLFVLVRSGIGGEENAALVANLPSVLGVGFAFAAALWCALQFKGGESLRRQWLFLSLGAGSYFLGMVVWTYYEVVLLQEAPFPGLPDVFFLLVFPLLAVGVFTALSSFRKLFDMRPALVISAVACLLATAAVYFGVGQAILADPEMSALQTALSILYPIGDVWLLLFPVIALIITAVRMRAGTLVRPWWAVSGGLLLIFAADVLFTITTWNGTYVSGSPIDLGWLLGYLLIAIGASLAVDVQLGARTRTA